MKLIYRVSLIFNLMVAALVVWFWNGGGAGLFKENIIKPAYERLTSQFERMPSGPADTVFLGDSITREGLWHELFPGYNVVNRGINGDMTAGVLARLDQMGTPGKLFLMIGTNDIAFGGPARETIENIVRIIDKIAAQSPGTRVFVQSILPRAEKYKTRVESMNRSLESAVSGKAVWIDLYPLFLNQEGTAIDERYSNDSLHLNAGGYTVWKKAILPFVQG